jgi:hypothetical protein
MFAIRRVIAQVKVQKRTHGFPVELTATEVNTLAVLLILQIIISSCRSSA